MNTVDIVLLIILLVAAVQGFRRGFVLEVVSMLALILAIFVGFKLLHEGMEFLRDQFDISGSILPYLSFILLFVGTILLLNFLGKIFKKVIDMTLLGSIDNLAGSLFAALKWAFGISALLWIFNYFAINPLEQYTDNAILYPVIVDIAPTVISFIAGILPFGSDILNNVEQLAFLR